MKKAICIIVALAIAIPTIVQLTSCYKESDYDPSKVNPADIITELDTIQDLPLADGSSLIPILVKLNRFINDTTKVTISISNSTFFPAESNALQFPIPVDTSAERQDTLSLKAPVRAGNVVIKARVGIYERVLTFKVETAPIEGLSIQLPSITVIPSFHDSAEVQINVFAFRSKGKPSPGQAIDFKIVDALGAELGYFRNKNNITDADRKCTYYYRLGTSTLPNGTVLKAKAYLGGVEVDEADIIVYN